MSGCLSGNIGRTDVFLGVSLIVFLRRFLGLFSPFCDACDKVSFKSYVDCSGLAAGEGQNVVLQFENPEGITVQNTSVTVDVVEEKKEDSEEEAEN